MPRYQTGTVANSDAAFQAMRAALVANGWTEHDIITDSFDNRDIVFRGGALDPIADNRPYIRITWPTGNFLFRAYRGWDAVAHVGFQEAGQNGFTYFVGQASSFTYFYRVNPWAMAFCHKTSGPTYWVTYAGFLRRALHPLKSGLTKTTQAYASGVSVMNVASDMTGKLRVGQRVLIFNNSNLNSSANKLNAQVRIIQAIAPTQITFTAVTTQAFDTGAVIGWNPSPTVVVSPNFGGGPGGNYYSPMHLDGVTNGGINNPAFLSNKPVIYYDPANPGALDSEYGPGLWQVSQNMAGKQDTLGFLYHWAASMSVNATPANEAIMDAGNETYVTLANTGNGGAILLLGPR